MRTDTEFREAAEEYRIAPSAVAAKSVLRRNGLRWSEFLRLRYWSPTRSIVIDPMHTWFLNNMNYHLRNVICIETTVKPPFPTVSMLTAKQIAKAERVWKHDDVKKRNPKGLAKLYRLTKIEMLHLCNLCGVTMDDPEGKVPKKVVHNALLASDFFEKTPHYVESFARLDPYPKGIRIWYPIDSNRRFRMHHTIQQLMRFLIVRRGLER